MNLQAFLSELKRRRVFRVAATYAVVAFVIAQVSDIFFPGLGLPPWSLRLVLVLLILGFPISLVLAWAFDITQEGVVRTADVAPAASAPAAGTFRAWGSGRTAVWLGVGLLVVLVAAGAWALVPGRRAAAPAQGVSLTAVAVLPFSVRGSAQTEYLGEGMVDLLSAKLDGAGTLRAVDPRALLGFLQREGGSTDDPERGRAVAQHFGAGLYILGNILEVGGRLQLSASLYREDRSSSPVMSTRVEGDAERIWELVDQLAAQLLAEQIGRGERLTGLAATTTESFPALRAFLDGESAFRVGNFQAAIDAFRRAVATDSTFALAHYRLAMAAAWAFDPALALTAIEQAVHHADRLSERDRRLVSALQLFEQGRAAEAELIYRSLVTTYPDDLEAWYQLGEVLIHHNAFRGRSWQEARAAFDRAVALQPDHELSITHLLLLDVVEGRTAEAGAWLAALDVDGAFHGAYAPTVWLLGDAADRARAFAALRPAVQRIVEVVAWLAHVGPGTHETAADVARLLTEPSRPMSARAAGHRLLAHIELGRGRRQAAREALLAAEALDPASALQHRALLTLTPFLQVSRAELESLQAAVEGRNGEDPPRSVEAVSVEDSIRPQLRLYLLGLLSASLGDEADALERAAELERRGGPASSGTRVVDLALSVRAEAARARADVKAALSLLERAPLEVSYAVAVGSPFLFLDRERFLRAELLNAVGRREEAIGWYTAVAETSIAYSATAHLRLAEIHDQLGNGATAARHFARFIAAWENCDPELRPARDEAERRLIELRRDG
jgi:tetratricopeptide (TPR) repeat protein